MSKWCRLDNNLVQEVITYNPYEVINENFHHLFVQCPEEVELLWSYDPNTGDFTPPVVE
jgi:hypothetical protein